jgi:hypothetical protein
MRSQNSPQRRAWARFKATTASGGSLGGFSWATAARYAVLAAAAVYLLYFSKVVGRLSGRSPSAPAVTSKAGLELGNGAADGTSIDLPASLSTAGENAKRPLRSGARREVVAEAVPPPASNGRIQMKVVKGDTKRKSKGTTNYRSSPFKALIFTMDSIVDYVEGSKRGGPAGEILIRECLQKGLRALGGEVTVATSDAEFNLLTASEGSVDKFDLFFLDPWTAFGAGWQPRPFLLGRESQTFLLSFFGLNEAGHGLDLPIQNILTPYPILAPPPSAPGEGSSTAASAAAATRNSFLGYFVYPKFKGTIVTMPDEMGAVDPTDPSLAANWQQKRTIENALMSLGFGLEEQEMQARNINMAPNHEQHGHIKKKTTALDQASAGGKLSAVSVDGVIPGQAVAPLADLPPLPVKRRQGVVWGKKSSYFDETKWKILERLALNTSVDLHFTLPASEFPSWLSSADSPSPAKDHFKLHGHLSGSEWNRLLSQSKFMIGLGE